MVILKKIASLSVIMVLLLQLSLHGGMAVYPFLMKPPSPANCPLCLEDHLYYVLTSNPLRSDVTYFATYWFYIDEKKLYDTLHFEPPLHKGFTVLGAIKDIKKILPACRRLGIEVVFAVHTPKSLAYRKVDGVTIVPFPHISANGVPPAAKKDVLYSFVGSRTDKVRAKIFSMKHPEDTIIIRRTTFNYNYSDEIRIKNEIEYKDILSRSRFSLCPRGNGPNTLRLWESLQAGAIPILLSDVLALPDGFDWDSCMIRVAEADVESIPEIIRNVSPEQESYMREQCLKAYELFSGEHLADPIRRYYGELQ